MSSGNVYERFVKLLASLMDLVVLKGVREIEVVCAILQKLVFEFRGYPTYKNWPAICQLADHPLMPYIAGMTPAQMEGDIGRRLIALFPECFSLEPVSGPIPWSQVVQKACANHTGGTFDVRQHVVLNKGHEPFDIYVVEYAVGEASRRNYPEMPVWPLDPVLHRYDIGDEVEIDGQKWNIISLFAPYSPPDTEIAVVPLGAIDFNA